MRAIRVKIFLLLLISFSICCNLLAAADSRSWCILDSKNPPCGGAPGRCVKNSFEARGRALSHGIILPSEMHIEQGGFVANTAFVEKKKFLGIFSGEIIPYVHPSTQVCGHAKILGGAVLGENVVVSDNATVTGAYLHHARVYEDASVYGTHSYVGGSSKRFEVSWRTEESDFPFRYDREPALSPGEVRVYGTASIRDSFVFDNAHIFGSAEVQSGSRVSGNAKIYGSAKVLKKSRVDDDAQVSGNSIIHHAMVRNDVSVVDARLEYTVYGNWCIKDRNNPPCGGAPGECFINSLLATSTRNLMPWFGRQFIEYGGFVANTALVKDTPYIDSSAQVCGRAEISGDATILSDVVIRDNAKVGGNAVVYDQVQIFDNAQVFGSAHILKNARIHGSARINENAGICENADISGDARIEGDSFVHGSIAGEETKAVAFSAAPPEKRAEWFKFIEEIIPYSTHIHVSELKRSLVPTYQEMIDRQIEYVRTTSNFEDYAYKVDTKWILTYDNPFTRDYPDASLYERGCYGLDPEVVAEINIRKEELRGLYRRIQFLGTL